MSIDPPEPTITTPFERMRPMLGVMIGFAVIYGAMFGAYYFWRTLSERKFDNSGDLILAGLVRPFCDRDVCWRKIGDFGYVNQA